MTGRRLAAATLVLATVTGTLAAAPAFAAPATGALSSGTLATETGTQQQDPFDLPDDSSFRGSGPSGFLTSHWASGVAVYRWTRYEDGSVTALPAGTDTSRTYYEAGARSDVVVGISSTPTGRVYSLYDMGSGGTDPVVIDASHLGDTSSFSLLAGSTVVVTARESDGGTAVHLLSSKDGQTVDRTVQGLPGTIGAVHMSTPDTVVVQYSPTTDTTVRRAALVDVATATVVEDRPLAGAGSDTQDVAASATHLAWAETTATGDAVLRVARRGQDASERIPLGKGKRLGAEFLGDWVAYGLTGSFYAPTVNPLNALTARSLKDGRTVKLLDLVSGMVSDGDDGILVDGATVKHGRGLFRITAGPEGDPVVTPVALTGQPIVLQLTGQSVPTTADFSKGIFDPTWQFAAYVSTATVRVEVKHTASGRQWTQDTYQDLDGRAQARWYGRFDNGRAVPHGSYTWRMTARTRNGIGPVYERSGTFTVGGRLAPHGFTNSSRPDLLFKGGNSLAAFDVGEIYATHLPEPPMDWPSAEWSTAGWGVYDHLVTPGDIGGAAHADVLGRDRYGVLWQHLGTGDVRKPFAPRTRVGTGWQAYRLLTGGSDLTGDGRPDLVGVDNAGVQWLHKGTGNWSKPFAGRVKVGGGWGVYNLVTATGNLAGGPAGDHVARDKDGVLWLHLGKGDGTFAPRTRIGGGWNRYATITAVGDIDGDGRPDLFAAGGAGAEDDALAVYQGTGRWATPFADPRKIYNVHYLWGATTDLY
ncbi:MULTISPECIES: VCBS repeat-containing protein [unclassified Streptomyces]|uniref:FG-GAP repeat domain-containing protein n=1 Tax=unclassified Streptomyces TaxID=2593676 RepID=UPI001E3BC7BE|nr:VCBS repeat-containing protein [Streptomyces sp. CB02980]MCB8907989.1 VCBS repeat-containing protein [Streptomyces sp. CB02980]